MSNASHIFRAVSGPASDERYSPRFSCVFLGCSWEDYQLASGLLHAAHICVHRAGSLEQADSLLGTGDSRVLLTEVAFPGGTWRDALAMTARHGRNVVLVVTAALADERFWLDVLDQGAYDLILKPFVAEELLRILENADACARTRAPAEKVRTAGLG
jgi:DNA-binding NtrC family response regulator